MSDEPTQRPGADLEFAFGRLNLRRNPFGEPRPGERPALAVVDIERFVPRIERGDFVVQFIGEQGRGKSTHMRALHAHFPDVPYIYIGEGERPHIPVGAPRLFLDETQRVGWWTRRKLWRSGAGLAIATHQDHRREFEAAGIAYEVVEVGGLDAEKLRAILERRIEWARRGEGDVPWFEDEDVEALLDRFGDDIRGIERYLYGVIQSMQEVGRVQA